MKSNLQNLVGTLQTNVNNNATAMSNIQTTVSTLQTGFGSVPSQTTSNAMREVYQEYFSNYYGTGVYSKLFNAHSQK